MYLKGGKKLLKVIFRDYLLTICNSKNSRNSTENQQFNDKTKSKILSESIAWSIIRSLEMPLQTMKLQISLQKSIFSHLHLISIYWVSFMFQIYVTWWVYIIKAILNHKVTPDQGPGSGAISLGVLWLSILWLPDAKNWLIGKDPDAGKDWRWEEKGTTEDEMVGW